MLLKFCLLPGMALFKNQILLDKNGRTFSNAYESRSINELSILANTAVKKLHSVSPPTPSIVRRIAAFVYEDGE